MKIVALEEHFATLEVMDAWKSVDHSWRDLALRRRLKARARAAYWISEPTASKPWTTPA